MLFEEGRLVFIKNARCAGTSMMTHLGDRAIWYEPGYRRQPNKIMVVHSLSGVADEDRHLLEGAHVFMVCRDPYSRIISGWRHLLRGRSLLSVLNDPPRWPKRLTWPSVEGGLSPDERRACSGYTHFTVTLRQNADLDGQPRCDTLLRLENLEEHLGGLIGLTGLDIRPDVKKFNGSNGQAHRWSPDERRLANQRYREDFEYLGYPMIEP